jgi:general secretion pathway protein D
VLGLGLALWSRPAEAQINLNLQEAQISELIKILSQATGKTFVPHDTLLSVKVTIVTPGPVSLDEAYKIFLAVLRIHQFTTVEEGNLVKIVPIADVKTEATRTYVEPSGQRLTGDAFVTQVVFLKFASADTLSNVLRPLVSVNGLILSEPSANAIVLTDTGDNVRRFLRLLESLDVEGARRQLEVYFLKYANAETLGRSLGSVLEHETRTEGGGANVLTPGGVQGLPSAGGAPAAPPSIVSDERTNALVAFGTPEQLVILASLVAKLDVPGTVERSTLHVYRLKHADAKDLSEILTAQVKDVNPSGDSNTSHVATMDRTALQQTSAPAAAPPSGPGPTQVVGQFEGKVTVTPDVSSNSLVIAAIPEDYRILQNVIEQLDERRTQVFVEALILEATAGAAQKIGVELRFPTDPNSSNVQPIGGTTFPVGNDPSAIGQVTQNPFSPPGGLVVGAVDGTISFNGRDFVNLAGLAQAVQSDNLINVLSAPHTTTLDNKEAEIIVGESRPFLRSQQSTDIGTVVNSFDFKDVGITLKFTPHLGVGGTVRLDLSVEITNFVSEAQNNVGAVTTTKRSVTTSVLVDSGQMAVIGGLMQDQETNAAARVPCLGSLPLAGWLFKSTSRDHRKTNLLIFVQPRILEDRQSLEELRQKKQQEFDEIKPKERTLSEDVKDILKQMETKPPK